MGQASDKEAQAGTALYTSFFLHFYDWSALKFNLPFIWKCPSDNMLALYNEFASSNHLDFGPGTGYFLNKCRFPTPNPRLALMDLNLNCLASASKRLKRYEPETYQCNALEPVSVSVKPFESIALINLLHCLPGTMKSKSVLFDHVKALLNPGGCIFGSTILGKGVHHTLWARLLLKWCNIRGYMTNYEDDYDSLKEGLEEHFQKTSINVIGSVALFSAQK